MSLARSLTACCSSEFTRRTIGAPSSLGVEQILGLVDDLAGQILQVVLGQLVGDLAGVGSPVVDRVDRSS